MYYAEAIVLGRYGEAGKRALLDDLRVVDYLKQVDAPPWRVLKALARRLFDRAVPFGRAGDVS